MKQLTAPVAIIMSAIIFALTIIAGIYLITQKDTYINNIGSVDSTTGQAVNTIHVSGDGKVFAQPDMLSFNVEISEVRDTTKEALDATNTKIAAILAILESEGIDESDIQTTYFTIYPEYDWTYSERKLLGQNATQTLTVKVKDLDASASKAATILDKVTEVEKAYVHSIYFDIEDKKELFTLAREEAYAKAEQKAQELADLSGVKLLRPISISDTQVDYSTVQYKNVAMYEADMVTSAGSDTSIATGQLEISANLSIMWGIE